MSLDTLALERLVGVSVARQSALAGGDINEAYRVELGDGRVVFVKTRKNAPPTMYRREAEGLAWLAEAQVVAVPEVVAVSEALLVLSFLAPGPRRPDFDRLLGEGLAKLHRAHPEGFGFHVDNFIGSLPQSNRPHATWAAFYREERLRPQLVRARRSGHLEPALVERCERVLERMEHLVGPEEPPARLHGDLWGGNLHTTADGRPALIDPAVYGGHREMDLAMMELFGGFSPAVFAAYDAAYRRAPGHERRLPLYQLYPLLVHVNLFGRGYVSPVRAALAKIHA